MDLPEFTERRANPTPGARWLFVGRVVPNKAIHSLVAALAAYRHGFDPSARLTVVGSLGLGGYVGAVRRLVDRLELADACTLTGPVSDDELRQHWIDADVFVCLSEHEGFCVPVVEAMASGLPVVALDATAVGETLGDGGVLLPRAQPTFVAAAVHRVVRDATVRADLVARGRQRAQAFAPEITAQRLLDVVRPVLAD
jgi:glycosyltransferase involved in cell wall biosynthesis